MPVLARMGNDSLAAFASSSLACTFSFMPEKLFREKQTNPKKQKTNNLTENIRRAPDPNANRRQRELKIAVVRHKAFYPLQHLPWCDLLFVAQMEVLGISQQHSNQRAHLA